jgi:TolB protein
MNADGSEQRELTQGDGRNLAHSWSPDGRRIAFSRLGVYVINADGTEEQRLSQDGEQPSWSPDGRKITFERNLDIYVMNADGSGQRKLTRGADRESQPVWSPAQKK